MAASITLASVAVDSTGKTVTATISGGSGTGYAITDKTGLFLTLSGALQPFGFPITSVAVSGSTLTITLTSPVGSGETVRLSIQTGSNLTDSASNTPTGQSNIGTTNNSTVTVSTYDATSGKFEMTALPTGTPVRRSQTNASNIDDWPVEFTSDGTEYAVLCVYNIATTFTIDGGATTTAPADGTPTWDIKPLTTAPLAAGQHVICLDFGDYFYGVRIAGGTRSITSIPTTKHTLLPNTKNYLGIPAATAVSLFGSYGLAVGTGAGAVSTASPQGTPYGGMELDVGFTGSALQVLATRSPNTSWATEIDGAAAGALVAAGDASVNNTSGWVTIHRPVSSGAHQIHCVMVGEASNSDTAYLVRVLSASLMTAASAANDTSVTVDSTTNLAVGNWVKIDRYGNRERRKIASISGNTVTFTTALSKAHAVGMQVVDYTAPAGTLTSWAKQTRAAGRCVAMGDSNTQGANDYGFTGTADANGNYYSYYDPRTTGLYQACTALNYDLVNLGIQGQITSQMVARKGDLATFAKGLVDVVTIWPGTNDINGNTGYDSPATYQSDVQTLITAAQAILKTGGRIVLMPPLTPVGGSNGSGLSPATALSALQSLASSNANTVCASDLATGLVTADYNGVHYHASGQNKIGTNIKNYLSGQLASLLNSIGMFFAA